MTDKNSTTHSYTNLDPKRPKTASKPVIAPKKRGRPGNQIATAFKNVPTGIENKVNFDEYCKKYKIKPTVLRQIKRHDSTPEAGRVYVKKNTDAKSKQFGTMEIWRDTNQMSPWLTPEAKEKKNIK